MNTLLIKNAQIVNTDGTSFGDVLVENGIITKIGDVSTDAEQIIDLQGKFLFPGGIDPHVHLHLPVGGDFSSDDFLTGTLAALKGGTTSIVDFVTPHKGQSLVDAYKQRLDEAKNAKINVRFHVSPVEWRSTTASEMSQLVEQYGVRSFKIYTAYKHAIGIDDQTIINVLETAKKLNALVTVHCESDEIINYLRRKFVSEGKTHPKYHPLSRPAEAEAEAIHRIIVFAKFVDTPVYIVHVSTKRGIENITKAKQKGVKIYAETCPHYLLLDDSVFETSAQEAAKYVLSPPLRKAKDQNALWQALANGVVDTIGTDHCPFTNSQKIRNIEDFTKIPNGAGSIEHRLLLMLTYGVYDKKISFERFVELTSYNPAKLFGYDNKGAIKEGFDADMFVYNPDNEAVVMAKNHYHNSDNDIYEGFRLKGQIETVILGGKIVSY